jgi:Domain of unknown function (DUF4349)
MSEHDPSTATIERELAAVEDALAGGVATSDEASARELQELALALRAEAPEPDPEFARELRTRAKAGFPPATGSLAATGASLREPLRPAKLRRALPAMGVIGGILVPIVLVASLAGSPDTDDADSGAGGGGAAVRADDGGGSVAPEAAERAPSGGSAAVTVSPGPPPQRFAPGQSNRKIERSIGLELEAPVDEMQRVADQVTSVTNRHGGFVLNSSLSTGDEGAGGDFELRIPSNRLRPALRDLSSLATVRSQSQSGRDVTREHVTARDRLQAARAERRSLLRRLEDADTDEEAEAIRTRLDLVSAEINGLRAQLRDLRLRTNYAVVTVTLLAAEDSADEGVGAAGSFDDAVDDAGDLLAATAGIIIRVLAVALPLALIAGLAWLIGAVLRRRRRESALA